MYCQNPYLESSKPGLPNKPIFVSCFFPTELFIGRSSFGCAYCYCRISTRGGYENVANLDRVQFRSRSWDRIQTRQNPYKLDSQRAILSISPPFLEAANFSVSNVTHSPYSSRLCSASSTICRNQSFRLHTQAHTMRILDAFVQSSIPFQQNVIFPQSIVSISHW